MERVTFHIPERHLERIDKLVEDGQYPSRSEAVRAAVREVHL